MTISIRGVRINRISTEDLSKRCLQILQGVQRARPYQVVTVNPEFIMEAQKNAPFRAVLNDADCALADGVGLVLASGVLYGWRNRLLRITGVDFTLMLANLCARTGKSMYLLGADAGVAEKAADALQKKYPSLRVAGAEEGIKKDESGIMNDELRDDDICKKITESNTDVLLVAFGAPGQDLWIARNAESLRGVKIVVGVGGTFDYLAGVVPYAPQWVRSVGFEWLYRLITQPRRFRRIVTAVIHFPLAVLCHKFHH
ncbi:WecB/TagA/CpsF family glycosyltransferase [Candidatus Uhrbacteria bacterium]|nr:WecB/TagA/CpsF family glycosyltransferase [Candidatus Uhrbacteria bacterium]